VSVEAARALPLSDTAERLAAAIATHAGGRVMVDLADLFDALDVAEPALTTAPGKRQRLAELIAELTVNGIIEPSRTRLDRSEIPALPAFIRLLARPPARAARESAGYPWRPELGFAASESLSEREFANLRAVQAFLRDGGAARPVVPAPERSLELFGHEKVLDEELRTGRLWGSGRLNYELLRARRPATPLAHRVIGEGTWILVAENAATFDSLAAALPADSPVGIVAWGGGGLFRSTVEGIADLADITGREIGAIRYFGDLDVEGLRIPVAASALAERTGLPPVRPAIGLYARLLRAGRPEPTTQVSPEVAAELAAWLGTSLAPAAAAVLAGGRRLAQEAVGIEWLRDDQVWPSVAGLGPGRTGVPMAGTAPIAPARPLPSLAAGPQLLRLDDDGIECAPVADDEWAAWVPAGRARNWILGDPLLDWLHLHGADAGLVRDDLRAGYDQRTDFRRLVRERGIAFEAGVMGLLRERAETTVIATERGDARSLEKAEATMAAMRAGTPVIAQAVLRNPANRTYGVADLLVRSDVLASWFPEALSFDDAAVGAPGSGQGGCHYRVIDIKFHTFDLTADGHVGLGADQLAYAGQVWLYNEALGRLQGYTPPAAYLLGRTWQHGDERGEGCLERLARVDHDRWVAHRDSTLGDIVGGAIEWMRRVRENGARWQVLPEPSVPELYPHARNTEDAPWHAAKREIAEALEELTLLPAMNPSRRAGAHAAGIRRWSDAAASAGTLGVTSEAFAARLDAVLAANRSPAPTVVPEHIGFADPAWRAIPPLELFVDFETVSNLADDMTSLPALGGQPQIVQIGCGHQSPSGEWCFRQWTVDMLSVVEEGQIVTEWIEHMRVLSAERATTLSDSRICHWSAAEPVNLETAYNAARTRHPDAGWPTELPWFDVLERVVRAEPVAVTGAFNFGLKAIAKAMHAAGFIESSWGDGPTDGLGAMVGLWSAAAEARERGIPLSAHELVVEIAAYNEVDCRVMSEVLAWLRENR
jgi:hypothetical protein